MVLFLPLFFFFFFSLCFGAASISFAQPVNNSLFTSGQTILLSSSAVDAFGAAVPATNFTLIISYKGVERARFNGTSSNVLNVGTMADDARTANDVFVVRSEVFDGTAVTQSTEISLVPDLCALSLSLLAGSPPVSVTFQGQATLLPSTLNVLRGALINVDVASPQNGEVFLSWSDGLPAAHAFLVPQSATANLGVSFGLPTTTGTGSVASTTPSATTAPPIRLPPGCLLRPTVPNLRYERVVITLQQDFNSTNCDTFMIGLYRDMQLSSSSQLFLVDVREGSFIATVDISDPNAQGIATNFVARVSRGTTNQFYCVVYGGVTTCYPDLPLWMLMGIILLCIIAGILLILFILSCIRRSRNNRPYHEAKEREIAIALHDFDEGLTPRPGQKFEPSVAPVHNPNHQVLYTVQDRGDGILQAAAGDVVVIQAEDWAKRGAWVYASLRGQSGWIPTSYVK